MHPRVSKKVIRVPVTVVEMDQADLANVLKALEFITPEGLTRKLGSTFESRACISSIDRLRLAANKTQREDMTEEDEAPPEKEKAA